MDSELPLTLSKWENTVKVDRHRRRGNYVSASELADMEYCERKIALEVRFGKRMGRDRAHRAAQGTLAHEAFFEEGVQGNEPRRPGVCVIAKLGLANAEDQDVLRRVRDQWLEPNRVGRLFVQGYYKCGAGVQPLLEANRMIRRLSQRLVTSIVNVCRALGASPQ